MEYIDLIFGAVLAFFVILGIAKGLFREVFGLIGFLGGIVAGILYILCSIQFFCVYYKLRSNLD